MCEAEGLRREDTWTLIHSRPCRHRRRDGGAGAAGLSRLDGEVVATIHRRLSRKGPSNARPRGAASV